MTEYSRRDRRLIRGHALTIAGASVLSLAAGLGIAWLAEASGIEPVGALVFVVCCLVSVGSLAAGKALTEAWAGRLE